MSTSNWDESYVLDNNIFNQNFQVVDSFNTPILPNQSAPAISLVSVTLTSVLDGFDVDVQFGGGTASYFELWEPVVGSFNIRLKQPYISLVYFSQEPREFNFTFNLTAITTDGTTQTTSQYVINAAPSNITPIQPYLVIVLPQT